jgi:FtsH-binding integral membrane protein
MIEVKKPASSNSTKNLKNEISNENLSAPEISHESKELPVEIKQNEHIEDSDIEVNEESIQIQIRAGFIRKVYGILSIQLIITFGCVFLFQLETLKLFIMQHQQFAANILMFCSFTFLVLFLILVCNRNLARTVPCNYIYLFAITICESLACSIISSLYSFQIVATALALTIVSTLVITFYACTTKTNFSYYRMGMFILFSQIFMIGLIAALFRLDGLYSFYTFLMTIMVGFYLVYDTQLIMGKFGVAYSVDDYIFATLEIYMDIIRLFLLILRILGRNRRN